MQTMVAYRSYGASPSTLAERVNFYVTYLGDVVPYDVAVIHIPYYQNAYDLTTLRTRRGTTFQGGQRAEEIQLRYEGKIFMTCIVSMEVTLAPIELLAGTLAHGHWQQGSFVRDRHIAWRSCLCQSRIKFFSSRHGEEWILEKSFDPMEEPGQVAAYLREKYELSRLR